MTATSTQGIANNPTAWETAMLEFCGQKSDLHFGARKFTGELASWQVGGVNVARMQHNLTRMVRPCVSESRIKGRDVILLFQRQGESAICQDNVRVELEAGDAILLDSYREFSAQFVSPVSHVLCYLPAEEVIGNGGLGKLPRLRVHRNTCLLGRAAHGLIDAVVAQGPAVGIDDGAHARRLLIQLARGLLDLQKPKTPLDPDEPQDWRVRQFIDAHLADPDLSPARIATGCRVSVRRLHRIFATSKWSACEWIREQRLRRCHDDLTNLALVDQTITQIAYRWGFNDSAHFSRSFREFFGVSPSQVRVVRGGIAPS